MRGRLKFQFRACFETESHDRYLRPVIFSENSQILPFLEVKSES